MSSSVPLSATFAESTERFVPNILGRVEALTEDPRPRQSVKLTGAERLYRLRVGDYRVIYEVDADAEAVVIYYVRHRREAYRGF